MFCCSNTLHYRISHTTHRWYEDLLREQRTTYVGTWHYNDDETVEIINEVESRLEDASSMDEGILIWASYHDRDVLVRWLLEFDQGSMFMNEAHQLSSTTRGGAITPSWQRFKTTPRQPPRWSSNSAPWIAANSFQWAFETWKTNSKRTTTRPTPEPEGTTHHLYGNLAVH